LCFKLYTFFNNLELTDLKCNDKDHNNDRDDNDDVQSATNVLFNKRLTVLEYLFSNQLRPKKNTCPQKISEISFVSATSFCNLCSVNRKGVHYLRAIRQLATCFVLRFDHRKTAVFISIFLCLLYRMYTIKRCVLFKYIL